MCPSCKTKLNERNMCFYLNFERSALQIPSPYLSCFGYARLLRRQLRSHNRITSCFTSLQYNIRYQNNLSLVGISHSNSFIFFFPLSLSLSLSFQFVLIRWRPRGCPISCLVCRRFKSIRCRRPLKVRRSPAAGTPA